MSDREPSGTTSQRFGDYLLVEKIAEGGMAELFLAKRTGVEGFEKVVAIKRILPEFSWNPDFVSMFVNEAKIAARLSHPNIVQIFDFGKIDAFYFIAMEYVAGRTLRDLTRKAKEAGTPIPPEIACHLAARACAGLDHAHRKTDETGKPLRIVHRDVSPQNILVSYEGEVKVVDFGIAKAVAENSQATQGVLKGKLSYLSPEHVAGAKIDARADVFGMGVVLYELLTGEKLFSQSSPGDILEAITNIDSAAVARSLPDAPKPVREILRRALAAEPDERFDSAGAMQIALEDFLRSQGFVGGATPIASYMRLLFDESMGSHTIEILRSEVENAIRRRRRGGLEDLPAISTLSTRWWAALGGALAGALTLILTAPTESTSSRELVPVTTGSDVPVAGDAPAEEPAQAAVEAPAVDPAPLEPETKPGQAALSRALEAIESGDDATALREFETAFAQAPGLREENRETYGDALAREAKRLFARESPESIRHLRAAVDLRPDDAELRFLLAKGLAAAGEREAAAEEYLETIRIDPRAKDARFNLGVLYYREGKLEEAVDQYRRLLELRPAYEADVYFNLSVTLEKLGREREALAAVREGLVKQPGNDLLEKQKERLGG